MSQLENKSLTKDVEKGTDESADTPLLENKYPTKDVDKSTDEFADIKKALVTILSKSLEKFQGQYKGYIEWFKLYSEFKNNIVYNSFRII